MERMAGIQTMTDEFANYFSMSNLFLTAFLVFQMLIAKSRKRS